MLRSIFIFAITLIYSQYSFANVGSCQIQRGLYQGYFMVQNNTGESLQLNIASHNSNKQDVKSLSNGSASKFTSSKIYKITAYHKATINLSTSKLVKVAACADGGGFMGSQLTFAKTDSMSSDSSDGSTSSTSSAPTVSNSQVAAQTSGFIAGKVMGY